VRREAHLAVGGPTRRHAGVSHLASGVVRTHSGMRCDRPFSRQPVVEPELGYQNRPPWRSITASSVARGDHGASGVRVSRADRDHRSFTTGLPRMAYASMFSVRVSVSARGRRRPTPLFSSSSAMSRVILSEAALPRRRAFVLVTVSAARPETFDDHPASGSEQHGCGGGVTRRHSRSGPSSTTSRPHVDGQLPEPRPIDALELVRV